MHVLEPCIGTLFYGASFDFLITILLESHQITIHYLKSIFHAIFLYLGLKSTAINYQDGFKVDPLNLLAIMNYQKNRIIYNPYS